MSTDNHPETDQLQAFNLGRITDDQAVAIGEHLEGCPVCCQTLGRLAAQDPFVGCVQVAVGSTAALHRGEPIRASEWLGDYRIVREIGRGGMGVVYEAEQQSLGRRVALKVLPIRALTETVALERFRREARLAARLHHTNIVPVFEVGQEGDVCFYAMQYIPGASLDRVLARLRGQGSAGHATSLAAGDAEVNQLARSLCAPAETPPPGPLPEAERAGGRGSASAPLLRFGERAEKRGSRLDPDAVARVGLQAAQALAYAHARGVLHRDVKPSNLLLDDSGVVWVTDFGLAKGEDDDLTGTGDLLGTIHYMAPERFAGACDARADIYGLGLTLYELLTLQPAFAAPDRAQMLDQVRSREPARPRTLDPAVPRDLETVVLKATDKEPARRYQSAAALADDLQRFLDRRPTRARPLGPAGRLGRWTRRHPTVAGLLGAVAAVLLAGIAFSTHFALEADRRARQATASEATAQGAEARAREAEDAARRQSAGLLLDRGLALAGEGKVAEALHWMLASLRAAPDTDFQRLVRVHLATWGARVPTLRYWLDTPDAHATFSPDGKRLVTAGLEGSQQANRSLTLRFWDLRDGRPDGAPIRSGDFDCATLSFSPDGRTLLACSGRGQRSQGQPDWASRWDVAGRKLLGRSTGHRNSVYLTSWAPDGRCFLTGSADGTVRLWDGATGRALAAPPVREGVRSAAFSPDGRTILTVAAKKVGFWDVATGKELKSADWTPPPNVTTGAFSPDAKFVLLAAGYVGHRASVTVLPWDPIRRVPAGPARTYPSSSNQPALLSDGRVAPTSAGWTTADGARFASGGEGVKVWDAARERSRPVGDPGLLTAQGRSPRRDFRTVLFTPAEGRFWTGGGARWVQAWDFTGRPVGTPLPDAPQWDISRLRVTRDGRLAATVPPAALGSRAPVQIWDVASGRRVGPPLPQLNAVLAMDFSPDGKVLATGGHFHTMDLWDTATGKRLGPSLPQGHMVLSLVFAPNGKTLAVGTYGKEARLWDVASRTLRFPPLAHPESVLRVAFSPDSKRLLTLCPSAAYLWDVASGRRLGGPMAYRPVAEGGHPYGLFSPDGKVVLLGSSYRSFRLWDVASARPLGPPTPAEEPQRSCFAFSPDRRLVIAGHEDGTAQLWDVATSRPLGAPVVGVLPVRGVSFRPDGRSFLTVGASGVVRTWPVPTPLDGDIERLARSLRLATGLEMDSGQSVVPLTRQAWQEERRRWREREGERDWAIVPPVGDRDWHEARARDAEEVGAAFMARWHLDRLIALSPADWTLYARRARTYTDEGRLDLAEADYRRARERGAGNGLVEWFRHRAWFSELSPGGQPAAARWYREHSTPQRPAQAPRDTRR